ncbi:alkaline phosphatase D family protein [Kushneria konosiri]|uniref:PhoD-like phosphatase metallophosphatase domain-containing protein n=1 Tax=Kushneria konosiri TaxID=698828 RepID=A0A2Z2HIL2_9GAMM|nr:alkaline phosphatase D family protein [Kushneria konosiri]ARS53281.1 hypothetical protein B9G99_10800 [Kushneria konosiri]
MSKAALERVAPEETVLHDLPAVIAGPMLRRLLPERMTLWLVASKPLSLTLVLERQDGRSARLPLDEKRCRRLPIGTHAVVHMIDVALSPALDEGEIFHYDLLIESEGQHHGIADWAPQLCHEGESCPTVRHAMTLASIAHGSCRRPHHDAPDGLARLDRELQAQRTTPEQWPSLLMMSGDQIYADDVAGPMLLAITALVSRLGLYHEHFESAEISDSRALLQEPWLYQRNQLLPATPENTLLQRYFFRGKKKPIFTAVGADNHLISLSEILAMYLLVWSPVAWQLIEIEPPELDDKAAERFERERKALDHFIEELPAVRRVLAHLPTWMIFDDHDVTDDWNLTAQWEETALGHPFSRRIMGNAMIGYLICQGWGNAPERFDDELMAQLQAHALHREEEIHNALIDTLLAFDRWHYTLPTRPAMVVLDTRTRRWPNERSPHKPSGLMDWESLTELQQELMGHDAVIMVSAAPVFGVKLIETVQRVFVWFNRPLLVDAENWMSHRGAAYVMLNIFQHRHTPQNFIVLSGDVHYSFAYDVQLRGQHQRPSIWQVTSSGIRNEFPDTLLDTLDRINRWLFAARSPVNWLTKRRHMRIKPRQPDNRSPGERLVNKAGIGLLRLDDQGRPREILQLGGDDQDVRFERDD